MLLSIMVKKAADITNQVFGRLTVKLRASNNKYGHAQWECICSCGATKIIPVGSLRSGRTTSCGCYHKEQVTTHGLKQSPEYVIWCSIKARCYNSKHPYYDIYGGRGIAMSDEWKDSFEAFYRDMGPRPTENHSIDREKNNEGYSKKNCRWATDIEQGNNRSNNLFYEFMGEKKTLSQWCRELNLHYGTIYSRLQQGWNFSDAVTIPINHKSG